MLTPAGNILDSTAAGARQSKRTIVLVGASFRTSDIASRELIARRSAKLRERGLGVDGKTVTESTVLETCNRLEVYLASEDPERAASLLIQALAGGRIPRSSFVVEKGIGAARHLFRVASGLDSVVVGEEQILQQVRDAGRTARTSGKAKSILSALFDAAYSSGKRVRAAYDVRETDRSVSAFALGRALGKLGRRPRHVLLIGSGETAKLAALQLGKSTIHILSGRSDIGARFPTAKRVLRRELRKTAAKCDLIISATRQSGYVLTRRDLPGRRRTVVLDLGFPRNVDPSVGESKSVSLYNLDDVASWASSSRRDGLASAERMAYNEAKRFNAWLTASRLTPTLANIYRWAEKVREEETGAALRKLPRLSPHDRMVVEVLARRLTGKLLSPHAAFVKEVAGAADQSERLLLLESIFGNGSD